MGPPHLFLLVLFSVFVELAVYLAVVGALDGIHTLIEQRHLVGLKPRLEVAGDDLFIQGSIAVGDHKQLQGMLHDRMGHGDADTVLHAGQRHGG